MWAAAKKQGDERFLRDFFFFLLRLPVFSHTLLSAKLDDQWGNVPTLWGFSLWFVDFAGLKFTQTREVLYPLSPFLFFQLSIKHGSTVFTLLQPHVSLDIP